MGFILFEKLITEGFAFRVKNHRNMAWCVLQQKTAQHIQHTVHRAGRFTGGVDDFRAFYWRAVRRCLASFVTTRAP